MTRWTLAGLLLLLLLACGTRQRCDATCAGCCDASGTCQPGTDTQACGSGGATCADCVLRHSTCQQQRCVLAPDGGGPGGGAGGGTGGGGGGTGADAGAPSPYPDGGSRTRFWDGGSCAVKTDCPCFSSDDCGPGFTCHSEDNTGTRVYCLPGARGPGPVGATCAGESDCQSALCSDSTDGGQACSALCDVPAECPPALPRCLYIGFGVDRSICAP